MGKQNSLNNPFLNNMDDDEEEYEKMNPDFSLFEEDEDSEGDYEDGPNPNSEVSTDEENPYDDELEHDNDDDYDDASEVDAKKGANTEAFDLELYAAYIELGVVDEGKLKHYFPVLENKVRKVKVTKAGRLSGLKKQTALQMAKQANDPLYKKYKMHTRLRLELKEKIYKKYGSKAQKKARQLLNAVNKGGTVKVVDSAPDKS